MIIELNRITAHLQLLRQGKRLAGGSECLWHVHLGQYCSIKTRGSRDILHIKVVGMSSAFVWIHLIQGLLKGRAREALMGSGLLWRSTVWASCTTLCYSGMIISP